MSKKHSPAKKEMSPEEMPWTCRPSISIRNRVQSVVEALKDDPRPVTRSAIIEDGLKNILPKWETIAKKSST